MFSSDGFNNFRVFSLQSKARKGGGQQGICLSRAPLVGVKGREEVTGGWWWGGGGVVGGA